MTIGYELTERPEALSDGKNAGGSDIAAKLFVTGARDSIALPGANTDAIYGVTREVIKASGGIGSVMLRGKAIVTCAGTVTAGERVMPDTAGKAVTWTTGKSIGGIAQTTATNGDVEVELLGPGATAQ